MRARATYCLERFQLSRQIVGFDLQLIVLVMVRLHAVQRAVQRTDRVVHRRCVHTVGLLDVFLHLQFIDWIKEKRALFIQFNGERRGHQRADRVGLGEQLTLLIEDANVLETGIFRFDLVDQLPDSGRLQAQMEPTGFLPRGKNDRQHEDTVGERQRRR